MDRQAAAATIPQLNAARGGTLGIATGLQMQGAQASVDDQLLGDQKTTTAFAKVGGLTISQLDIEIFAEVMSQDLPRIVLDGSTVSRDMTLTSVSAAALRLKLNRGGGLRVSKLQNKACLAAFNAQPATRRLKLLQRDATDVPSNVHDACDLDKVNGTFSYAVSAGVRVLRSTPSIRADSNATAAVGGAFELIYQGDVDEVKAGHGYGWFVGLSGFHLNQGAETLGTSKAQFPAFNNLRASGGFEYRGSAAGAAGDLIPRVGAYAIFSHAAWEDPYTFDLIKSPQVYSSEVEAGVYVGGRFTSNFQGLVAFRVVRPFGTDEPYQWIVSLVPSVTSSPSPPKTTDPPADGTGEASPPAATPPPVTTPPAVTPPAATPTPQPAPETTAKEKSQ